MKDEYAGSEIVPFSSALEWLLADPECEDSDSKGFCAELGILWLEDVVKIDLECDPTRVYNLDTLVYHFLDFRLELAIIVNASGTHFGFLLGAIPLMPLRKRGDEVRPELSESDWQALTEFAEQSPHVKFARDESVDGDSLQNFVQSMGLPYISALIGDGDTIKKLETIDTEFCKELNKTITEGKMNFKDCAFMEYLLCLPRKTTQVLQPLDSDHISGVLKKKLKQFENDISEAGQQSENRLVAAFHVLISAFEELVQSTDAVKQSFDKTGNFPPSLAKMQQRCEEAGIAFPSEKKSEEEKDKITCEAWRFWNSVPASNIKASAQIHSLLRVHMWHFKCLIIFGAFIAFIMRRSKTSPVLDTLGVR